MIGWTFKNIPNRIVVRCRECDGPAVMEDPFVQVHGKGAKEILANPNIHGVQSGGSLMIERFPDVLRWAQARGRRFYFMDGALGVMSCSKCVSRYAHTLDWPSDAFYRIGYRGKVLWAWNREYLVMVREFIASPTRDTYGSYYLRRKIPKLFLSAKNRGGVVAKIDAVLEAK